MPQRPCLSNHQLGGRKPFGEAVAFGAAARQGGRSGGCVHAAFLHASVVSGSGAAVLPSRRQAPQRMKTG
ncbi:MAG TPA: hypothetical protein VKV26_25865 [Dehalococcoidia bacterium]|nr:hypothetical protein [Dehalococcoidia bacterium]